MLCFLSRVRLEGRFYILVFEGDLRGMLCLLSRARLGEVLGPSFAGKRPEIDGS